MNGLKAKRKARKMTLEDVARIVNVTKSCVSLWERDERFPRKPVLDKLCAFFNCKVDALL